MVGSRNNEQSVARGAARGAWLEYRRGRERLQQPFHPLAPCLERVSRVGHVCRHVCAASCWHWSSHHVQQVCTHMHVLHPAGMRRALPSVCCALGGEGSTPSCSSHPSALPWVLLCPNLTAGCPQGDCS